MAREEQDVSAKGNGYGERVGKWIGIVIERRGKDGFVCQRDDE